MEALKDKSMDFAVRIVNLHKYLDGKHIGPISNQVLRSGTAVGALYSEAEHAESRLDFVHKLAIAQKECNETLYWLELMNKTGYISFKEYESIKEDAEEILKLLTASIKTVKQKLTTNH
jgi:four helix bundle protein